MKSALIASVLVAAAAAAVAPAALAARREPTSNGPPPPPLVKDGVEIDILPQVGSGGGPASVTEIGLDLEAKTLDAAARLGFQSLRAVADVDCSRGANRFISAVAYQQVGLAGPGQSRNVTGQWVQPASDSYMAAVIARVCAAQGPAPAAHAPPVVKEMAAAPPPKPAPAAAPAPSQAPPAQAAAAPAAPNPTPPQVVKFSGSPPPPVRAQAAAPAPSGPLVVKFSGGQPETQGAATAPSYIPKVAGDRVAQVAASPNVHDAEKVLRELKPLIAAPLTTTIEQADVGGAHVYRADVVGFQTAADAKAFCRSVAHVSKTCWVRARNDAPAAKPAAKPAERLRPARRAG